jgi:hypothetical protein
VPGHSGEASNLHENSTDAVHESDALSVGVSEIEPITDSAFTLVSIGESDSPGEGIFALVEFGEVGPYKTATVASCDSPMPCDKALRPASSPCVRHER